MTTVKIILGKLFVLYLTTFTHGNTVLHLGAGLHMYIDCEFSKN